VGRTALHHACHWSSRGDAHAIQMLRLLAGTMQRLYERTAGCLAASKPLELPLWVFQPGSGGTPQVHTVEQEAAGVEREEWLGRKAKEPSPKKAPTPRPEDIRERDGAEQVCLKGWCETDRHVGLVGRDRSSM
jgi:hypothetical protein